MLVEVKPQFDLGYFKIQIRLVSRPAEVDVFSAVTPCFGGVS
jgi:hypothetical protein